MHPQDILDALYALGCRIFVRTNGRLVVCYPTGNFPGEEMQYLIRRHSDAIVGLLRSRVDRYAPIEHLDNRTEFLTIMQSEEEGGPPSIIVGGGTLSVVLKGVPPEELETDTTFEAAPTIDSTIEGIEAGEEEFKGSKPMREQTYADHDEPWRYAPYHLNDLQKAKLLLRREAMFKSEWEV